MLAHEIGLKNTPQAVHAALLTTGIWTSFVNPWPERNGCFLTPPPVPQGFDPYLLINAPRSDLRHLSSYAIDNSWSSDPDDAVSIEGNRVWVHIADPASVIDIDSTNRHRSPKTRINTLSARSNISHAPSILHRYAWPWFKEESIALSFGIDLDSEARIQAGHYSTKQNSSEEARAMNRQT